MKTLMHTVRGPLIKGTAVLIFLMALAPISLAQEKSSPSLTEIRYVKSKSINVYLAPDKNSEIVGKLNYLDKIVIVRNSDLAQEDGVWLKTMSPIEGYVFQRILIRKRTQESEPPKTSRSDTVERSGEPTDPSVKKGTEETGTDQPPTMSIGFGLGLWVLPEEEGYSTAMGDQIDLYFDYADPSNPLMNFRIGINTTKAGGTSDISTSSIYGAYRYGIGQLFIDNTDFFAYGGLAFMQSSISNGTTGSSAGFGLIYGGGLFYDFDIMAGLKTGAQFVIFSRQADFGGTKKFVGSNQLQLFAGYEF